MVTRLPNPLRPPQATEDFVFSFYIPSSVRESLPEKGMVLPKLSHMESGIRACINAVDESIKIQREQNDGVILTIPKDDQHVMVLSTGRCGTMSLTHLLYDTNLTPYHEYWWVVEAPHRHEMQARIQSAYFNDLSCANAWVSTRAVEWMGASLSNKPLVALNHLDTIFAPVFAALHQKSRFVWLKRDAESVFKSFYGKGQWNSGQLKPIQFSFNPFRYADGGYDLIPALAWYVYFTEVFIQSFKTVVGDRLLEINSEDLFMCDRDTIGLFLDFIGSDVSVEHAIDHFKKPINEKSHRLWCDQNQIEEATQYFKSEMERIKF